jgi:RNA 2',3'-cyclic 3'-phosphodiesterase
MADSERVRAFLAVPPDPAWAESARALLAGLRPRLPDASWTRPESWHVTLRFLGGIERRRLGFFSETISREAARLPGAHLSVAGPIVLPLRGPARVLGLELRCSCEVVVLLARAAEAAAREAGLEPEKRPFRPHVTLARVRRPWPSGAIALFRDGAGAWTFPRWPLRSCALFESELLPGCAVHTRLAEWALAPEGVSA